MKLTLILLFAFGLYSVALSQPQFNTNFIGSNYYQLDNPASLDTFLSFSDKLQKQAVLKSSEVNQLLLDSIVHEEWRDDLYYGPRYDKIVDVYGYDDSYNKNKILLQTITYTDYETDFVQDMITKMEYTKTENTEINTLYWWDTDTQTWKDSIKEEEIYNEENTERINIKSRWDSDKGDWVGLEKYEYHFYDRNQLNYSIRYIWETDSNKWEYKEKTEIIIDSLGRKTENKIFMWRDDLNCWIKYSKYEYHFESDTSTQFLYYLNLSYNYTDTIDWVPYQKADILYYPDGREKLISSSRWNWITNKWTTPSMSRYEYNYDSFRHITLYATYVWDYDKNDWENSEKQEYAYDVNGNKISQKRYYWPEDSTDWFLIDERESFFDNDNKIISFLGSYYDIMGNVHKQKLIYTYNQDGYQDQILGYDWPKDSTDWGLSERHTYYYSEYTVNVNNPTGDNLLIYPNPVNETLYFDLHDRSYSEISIEIYKINGIKMQSGILQQNSISTADLNNGIYFYHLTTGKKSFTGKFIVQH